MSRAFGSMAAKGAAQRTELPRKKQKLAKGNLPFAFLPPGFRPLDFIYIYILLVFLLNTYFQ